MIEGYETDATPYFVGEVSLTGDIEEELHELGQTFMLEDFDEDSYDWRG